MNACCKGAAWGIISSPNWGKGARCALLSEAIYCRNKAIEKQYSKKPYLW